MKQQTPILVTGSPRSGTTWVGKMLALAPEAAYIHEPFHPNCRPGISPGPIDRWYTYAPDGDEAAICAGLERTLGFKYAYGEELRALSTPRDLGRMVRDAGRTGVYRAKGSRPIMKDPIAVFSAEWLADNFAMDVVVLVRHPAAFASSLIRLDWHTDFNEFLGQPRLLSTHLEPFSAEIADAAAHPPDLIDQAALLWRMVYATTLRFQASHPAWVVLRHEDISREATRTFNDLYSRLGLTMTDGAQRSIAAHSDASNPEEAPRGQTHQLKRNSAGNVSSWKARLTNDQIRRVRDGVEPFASEYYADDDW